MSLIRSILRQRKRNGALTKRQRKVIFESLEPRLLLNASGLDPNPATIYEDNNNITSSAVGFEEADATDPNDYDKIVVSAMGTTQTFRASEVKRIYAEGGAGDDQITIQKDLLTPVLIYGDFADGTGNGNDTLKAGGGQAMLYGGAGDDTLRAFYSIVDIRGGEGYDTLVIQDDGLGIDMKRDLTLGGMGQDAGYLIVERQGLADDFVVFEGIEDVRLDLGSSGVENDLRVLNTINGSVTINGSEGDDEITVLGNQGSLTINGNGGIADTLIVERSDDTNGLTGTLSKDTITGLGFVSPITYRDIEILTLNLGSGADRLILNGTSANTTVNAGDGKDEVIVQEMGSKTTVYGEGDEDTLTLEIPDPNSLTLSSFEDLGFSAETLRLGMVSYG
jgi:hypothetical protein